MNRQDYINQITDALAMLSRKVEIRSALNLTDINLHAEDFYKDLLNLSFDYELININSINPNAAAIDLGDITNKIAIQVTSTSTLNKTRKTVEKFIEKKLYNDYDRLIILNIVKLTKHTSPHIGQVGEYELDTKKDMWDYIEFGRKIASKDSAKLKQIADFLTCELKIQPEKLLPKEVTTIIELIDHLSNCNHPDSGKGYLEEPDPNGKIYERFSNHSDFLTETYKELYQVYGPNLSIIKDETDIGTVQVAKKSLYLKSYSDKILNECNGDPRKALEKLTHHFSDVIRGKGVDYDETAITFFLVDELTRCNVFPNMETVNV